MPVLSSKSDLMKEFEVFLDNHEEVLSIRMFGLLEILYEDLDLEAKSLEDAHENITSQVETLEETQEGLNDQIDSLNEEVRGLIEEVAELQEED